MSKDTDALLHHPDVIRVIAAVLRMTGIRGDLLEDEIANVEEKAWRATERDRPDTIERWKKITRPIAKKHGITQLRKRVAHAKSNTGLTGDADDHAKNADVRPRWTEHDAKKALDLLWLMLDDDSIPRDFEVYLDAIQAGEPQEKIALEAGMTHARFRKQLMKVRSDFLQRCTAIGLGGLAVAAVLFYVHARTDEDPFAHHKPTPAVVDAASSARPPEVLVDTQKAALDALRTKAEEAVAAEKWSECHALYRQMDGISLERTDAAEPTTKARETCEEEYLRSFDSKTFHPRGKPTKK